MIAPSTSMLIAHVHQFRVRYRVNNKLWRFLLSLLVICYVTACGPVQEEPQDLYNYPPDFEAFLSHYQAHAEYQELVFFLQSHDAHNIVPVWQLLLQGTDFRKHNLSKYALPDRKHWDSMLDTLVFLKYELIPHIGDVRVLSGFRTPHYNRLAGGAGRSRHLTFSALDLRPIADIDRTRLHRILQNRWHTLGEDYNLGLGLYSKQRFHIDTGGHRQW